MSAQHTPAPWEIAGHCVRTKVVANDRGGIDGGHLIAECSCLATPDAERAANARLIAAAPDLLALAKQVATECACCDGSGWTSVALMEGGGSTDPIECPDCADIRAVIAKAEHP